MKKFKCRASALGQLMTNSRSKSEPMGETAKSLIREIWIKDNFGREQVINSKYMTKGNECEEDSMSLYTKVTNHLVVKNELHFNNEWLTGTPDIVTADGIIDIKTSWSIWTFANAGMTKDYEYQLRSYMMLCDKPKAELAYCLVDTPPQMVSDELYRMHFNYIGGDANPQYDKDAEQVQKNMTFSDIDPKLRVKRFTLERDLQIEEQIKERVKIAREYYNNLTL